MKNNAQFKDIEILKEKQRLKILEQELRIKSEFRAIGDRFTGERLKTTIQEGIGGNSGLAFKLGYMAVSLIIDRIRKRKKK